jgi:hypothetical protein
MVEIVLFIRGDHSHRIEVKMLAELNGVFGGKKVDESVSVVV